MHLAIQRVFQTVLPVYQIQLDRERKIAKQMEMMDKQKDKRVKRSVFLTN